MSEVVALRREKLLNAEALPLHGGIATAAVVLVVLAAGKGTRFGQQPKCIQPVCGTPLARHSIDGFRSVAPAPAVCLVGYRHEDVASALGADNLYVRSDNPAGGTAHAAYEALCVPGLLEANPLLVITMGDRVVPPAIFRRLLDAHQEGVAEAALTFLTARYEPPKHRGKGRILRDAAGRVTRIVEEQDIGAVGDAITRDALLNLTEGNCPLYAIRAQSLRRHLGGLRNDNAQSQYYLTDIVAATSAGGGEIRTITTHAAEPEYDLLCSDVTRPADLALLEGVLTRGRQDRADEVEVVANAIRAGRPKGQLASIRRQLQELYDACTRESLGFDPEAPVAIGISGGRLRIAFMHPDMGRFFGPAWQMPIGAGDAAGSEQIVVLAQKTDDPRIHLYPLDPRFRESTNHIPADFDPMFPGQEISDWHSYEGFGTRMSERLLLSLGYFSDAEIEHRRMQGLPLPPASLRVTNSMRRPFSLVGNAIASMRTLRDGNLGARVQACLGRERFRGLRLACTGGIPQGGFSSSSALTVATKNALNGLFELGIPADVLVHLACQAEYGTGVRAGSLDQATEQKGQAGQGTLISSNPADNYRILGTYPVPAERFRVIFPYTVDRDRESWRWSGGAYAESVIEGGPLTAGEIRKMTGKAAEIAAILVRLPLDTCFFKEIEAELMATGALGDERRRWVCMVLRQLPLFILREDLRQRVAAQREWYVAELMRVGPIDQTAAGKKADAAFESLFSGWREPVFNCGAKAIERQAPNTVLQPNDHPPTWHLGVPLRAMVAYLFGEVAKNFHLIHHPDEWIQCVARSQQGDRSYSIDYRRLPERVILESEQPWEAGLVGPARLGVWLERCGATPYDFNQGLDETDLATSPPPEFHRWAGGNFFRGLALIDLVEAMLQRAFGPNAIAVRVNAAGQGDYFQVHVDTRQTAVEDVKSFLRVAFYRRFGLKPDPDFVETHSGGSAVGIRLARFEDLPELVRMLD